MHEGAGAENGIWGTLASSRTRGELAGLEQCVMGTMEWRDGCVKPSVCKNFRFYSKCEENLISAGE